MTEAVSLNRSRKPITCHTLKSREVHKQMADSTVFDEFISHLLITDRCHNVSARHLTPVLNNVAVHFSITTPIFESVRNYGFISCYLVKPDTFIFSALSDPFDVATRIYLLVGFIVLATTLTILSGHMSSYGILVATGICFENSVLGGRNLFPSRFPRKPYTKGI
ncbi:hypothetical protein Fcan01_22058 [Folsomia candida]|uniref:Uncharacterized protein n=1 Tax=Folsomia candida TaxID=158441 RepID=A0A226DD15_FOLCA|nr:hypothetical protein Fcan01_22058 [Folsomia candida]